MELEKDVGYRWEISAGSLDLKLEGNPDGSFPAVAQLPCEELRALTRLDLLPWGFGAYANGALPQLRTASDGGG